ncbi:ArsR family transcriptional regulator [Mycolicibacterium sp. GF69]|uniref:helix-turn-helix transcriptional regulator n=1 Tax=Mycolicibacterium sp. GF69 TaxID=2267251 RepID=UPI000DCBF997|nr:ArsR family transcriptional regulator [Mycolicibacterium sp. GF69]RAV18367.1 ArsR family transcriptional regulator [Mycolicibacterium sp. GF69]
MTTAATAEHTHETHGLAPSRAERGAGQQRQRVLGVLRDAAGPVDARQVADALDIHITTARFHLSTLEGQRVVRRGTGQRHRGAGRPRLTYEIAPRLDYADIVALFAVHLGGDAAEREARALRIGADLARRVNLPAPPAGTAVGDLISHALGELGFQIHSIVNAFGAVTVQVCACPLAEIAARAPEVVSGIQQGLLQEILDVNTDALGCRHRATVRPDPHHGACQVHLIVHPER